MRSPSHLAFRFLLLAPILAITGCGRGCSCRPHAKAKPPTKEPAAITVPLKEPPPSSFREPVAGGIRRFQPLFGEEVVSLSGTPSGSSLVAVTSSRAYVFDAELQPTRAIELPGITPVPIALAISAERAAVLIKVPSDAPEGRLWLLDTRAGKFIAKIDLGGMPAFGAPLGPDSFAVVLEDPPTLLVLSAKDGSRLASQRVAGNPRRLEVAPDGRWAALACAGSAQGGDGGLFVADLALVDEAPAIFQLSMGQGKLHPEVALPVADAILVAGSAEGDRPVGVVVPRRGARQAPGEDLLATLAFGTGRVVGAALSANGATAVVFTADLASGPGGQGTAGETAHVQKPRSFLLDTRSWSTVAALDGGVFAPGRHIVAHRDHLVFPICHAATYLDVAAKKTRTIPFPSPQKGPCLDGIWKIGDRMAARDGAQILTWPQMTPLE